MVIYKKPKLSVEMKILKFIPQIKTHSSCLQVPQDKSFNIWSTVDPLPTLQSIHLVTIQNLQTASSYPPRGAPRPSPGPARMPGCISAHSTTASCSRHLPKQTLTFDPTQKSTCTHGYRSQMLFFFKENLIFLFAVYLWQLFINLPHLARIRHADMD